MPLLSAATSVRLGTSTASRLYLGTTQVWPAVVAPGVTTGALAGTTAKPFGTLVDPGPRVTGALAGTTARPFGTLTTGADPGTFGGADGAPWPAPWTGASGTADQLSGAGRLVTAASTYAQAYIRRPAPADAELLFKWKATVDLSSVDIAVRAVGNAYGDNPKWTYRNLTDVIWLSGASGLLDSASTTHTVGLWYWTRLRWQGTTVRGSTWEDGTTEPTSWMVEATDAASPTSGYLIFRVETDDATADTVLFDDIDLDDLAGGAVTGALAAATAKPSGALTGTVSSGSTTPGAGFGSTPFGAAPFGADGSGGGGSSSGFGTTPFGITPFGA